MKVWIPLLASFITGGLFFFLLYYFIAPWLKKFSLFCRRLGKVFASYAHKDEEEVKLIGQVIKALGGELIYDRKSLLARP